MYLKKTILTLLTAAATIAGFAQKTELGVQLNSGLFSFHGDQVKRNAYVSYNDRDLSVGDSRSSGGTAFGGKNGLNMGVGFNLKHVTRIKVFFAAEVGFDYSKSRISIDKMYWNGEEPANGAANLRFATIYWAPTIGYRLSIQKVNIDLGLGVDVSRLIKSTEKMDARSTVSVKHLGYVREALLEQNKSYWFDLRPHANLKVSYKRFGAFCSYSLGTTNYIKGTVGTTALSHTYSRLWRFGLSYQFS